MRKVFCVPIFLVAMLIPVLAEEQYDVRKVKWGMSKLEVKLSESIAPVDETDDSLFYLDNAIIANVPFSILYIFNNGRLSQVKYFSLLFSSPVGIDLNSMELNEDNAWKMIFTYNILLELLKEKYDQISEEPAEKAIIWKDETYKNDYTQLGKAFCLGHVFFGARWVTKRSHIVLMLHKSKETILELSIHYMGRETAIYQSDKELL